MSVELELPVVKQPPRQPGQRHVEVPKYALIGDVVNGEERADAVVADGAAVRFDGERIATSGAIFLTKIDGNKARLPVIGVQDFRPEIDERQRFQQGPAEEDESLTVI